MSNLINEAKAYKCPVCDKWYLSEYAAEKCCENHKKVCEDCGVELNPKQYFTVCDSCREKRRYNRCRKMTIEEYEQEFPGNMVIVGDDYYYSSVEEALEYYADNSDDGDLPHYVYGTKRGYSEINIDSAIEIAEGDAYEDAHFDDHAVKELQQYVDEWNERNKIEYFVEAKIVIDIPEDIRKGYYS